MWAYDESLVTLKVIRKKLSKSQFYKDLTRKNIFFEGCSWLKFINLELVLIIALKFDTVLTKGSFSSIHPQPRFPWSRIELKLLTLTPVVHKIVKHKHTLKILSNKTFNSLSKLKVSWLIYVHLIESGFFFQGPSN